LDNGGHRTAGRVAREGADVAIAYLRTEGSDARDVIDYIERSGGLDILVDNAGKLVSTPSIDEISSEQFDATLKTNLYALFWITKAALPHLKPGASLINTASEQGYDPSRRSSITRRPRPASSPSARR